MDAWLIRAGRGGAYAADWIRNGIVGIGWDFGGADIAAMSREQIETAYASTHPEDSKQKVAANVGQVFRFAHAMVPGDTVVMYDPAVHLYHIGTVDGPCQPVAGTEGVTYARAVAWSKTAPRDTLAQASKNSLGAIQTLSNISKEVMADLDAAAERREHASADTPRAASNEYAWVEFYMELADRLLPYKDDRGALIEKLQALYADLGMKFPKLDSGDAPADIDPYTVFGLFNKGVSLANRIKVATALGRALGVNAQPPTAFPGTPLLSNLNATFYAFVGDHRRGEHDIDNLWRVFEAQLALDRTDNEQTRAEFVAAYNDAIEQFSLTWKLSMGLYWARPLRFISLDSRNRWFLGDMALAGTALAQAAPKEKSAPIHDGRTYLAICDTALAQLGSEACPYASLPELSHEAFRESERVNKEKKEAEKAAEREAQENALGDAGVETEGISSSTPDANASDRGPTPLPAEELPLYGKEDFLEEVFMGEEGYDALVGVLNTKKNIILQGAPGVGKTFIAKRLAYSIMGAKVPERVQMVQFHQSYSYEDFIEGYRPCVDGFKLEEGVFHSFCKRAASDPNNDYFFIIDEINRGNLSRIFGELFMLIENDKRGSRNKLQLLYSHESFYVPANVYIIGMMNTADRSLAVLDYALRRRFAFFDLQPGFDTDGFTSYRESLGSDAFDRLIACVKRLNAAIAADDSLGKGFCIGHSYFCGLSADGVTDAKLAAIVEYELVPMLREYWFDEPSKVREWSDALRAAIK